MPEDDDIRGLLHDVKIRKPGSTVYHDFSILKKGEGDAHQYALGHAPWAWLFSLGKWDCPSTWLTAESFTPYWEQYDATGSGAVSTQITNMPEDHPNGLEEPDCCAAYYDGDGTYYPREHFWFEGCPVDEPANEDYAAQWGRAYASLGWKIKRLPAYEDERSDESGAPYPVRAVRIFFELVSHPNNSEEVFILGDPAGHDTGWILRWLDGPDVVEEISVPSAAQGQEILIESVPDEIEWTNTGTLRDFTRGVEILSLQIETQLPEGANLDGWDANEDFPVVQ